MDRSTPTTQDAAPRDSTPHAGQDSDPCPTPTAPTRPVLIIAQAFVQTVRHYFPNFNDWLQQLPDPRDPERLTYPTRFMAWWGLLLFVGQLGSRRQLDFTFDADNPELLANLNRLAGTQLTTRPVHDTLDYFLTRLPVAALVTVRHQMVTRLLRMKALDAARLLGHVVVALDGTGWCRFTKPHCDACLQRRLSKGGTWYGHQVLEAKWLGPAGVVVSIGTEFIDNSDAANRCLDDEAVKQDCELKAFQRLAPRLKADFPQLRLVLTGDALFACGATLQVAQEHGWSYVLTFKRGRLPTAFDEFQRVLPLCPENTKVYVQADGSRQHYRWVNDLSYTDDQKRTWTFAGLQCEEISPTGDAQYFAWLTDFTVTATNVEAIANRGGRPRWQIENEGFNRQKNSGLNLEHVYSHTPENAKAYYYLLQLAFMLMQLVERGSLLRQLAATHHRTPLQLFGSLTNLFARLCEAFKYFVWATDYFDANVAARRRLGLDTS